MTSRGCLWDCVYRAARALNGGRMRSVEDVLRRCPKAQAAWEYVAWFMRIRADRQRSVTLNVSWKW